MRISLSKWVWLALLGIAALVAVLVSLSGRQPAAQISAVHVTRANLSASITSNGKVEPITPYSLRAQYPTFVAKVFAVEGRAIKKGQPILALDANQIRADLANAQQQLLTAQEDLRAARAGGQADEAARIESDFRKAEIERNRLRSEREALQRLLARQAATRDELDQNEVALARAEADWERASKAREEFQRKTRQDLEGAALLVNRWGNEVRALEDKLRTAELTAPADGTLYSLPVRVGDFVKMGDLLAEVADLHRVRVRAFIDEPELGSLEPGQRVAITWDALPNRAWLGRTEQIPKQVVARGTRSVGEVLCSVDNDKLELLPNININVRIDLRQRANALAVPRGAVEIEGVRRFVYLVEGGGLGIEGARLKRREIKVGIASATEFEVLDGLQEGDVVALPGEASLRDGLRVRVVRTQ